MGLAWALEVLEKELAAAFCMLRQGKLDQLEKVPSLQVALKL